ncbi:hypothetical protein B0H13DRAFT_2329498 [Mycena leptocephala]|nr:hypothetical protein B0H13DRAFT_2329498 [Mycena leptocephala]
MPPRLVPYLTPENALDADAWEDQLEFLQECPDTRRVRMVLYTMSAERLFDTSRLSSKLYRVVSDYLEFLRSNDLEEDDGLTTDDESDSDTEPAANIEGEGTHAAPAGFDDLPLEIGLDILGALSYRERSRLCGVSVGSAHLAAMSLQSAAVNILSRFNLNFQDVRLMQTVTGAVISVVDFIMLSAHYEVTANSSEYSNIMGISRMWTMKLADALQIKVIESCTSNPLDLITTFHLSCVYGAWLANGVWHGYSRLTNAGAVITTPCRFPVEGFTITPGELPQPHECGKDLDCPATLRTSNDSGCSFGAFPTWPYSDEAAAIPATCWTMGGTGCRQGILEQDGQVISSSNWSADAIWYSIMRAYIDLTSPPH